MDGTREQCSWAVCTSGRPGSYPMGKQLLISQHSHRSPARGAGAPGTSSAPGNCPRWPLKLLLPEANSLHRGPLNLQTSLCTTLPPPYHRAWAAAPVQPGSTIQPGYF